MSEEPTTPRAGGVWTRRGVLELAANVAVIALIPIVSRLLYSALVIPARAFGFSGLFFALSGDGGVTDVGWEVAASRGLIAHGYSAYDTLATLDPLIGMGWLVDQSHSHPPTALPLGIPLAFIDYQWWLSFWVVASACWIALSMRVMRVPGWVAYPVAAGVCLSVPGLLAMESTYPLMALLIALAWAHREHPLIAGTSYGLIAASRGVGLILLAYPLARRQWRTLFLALGVVGALAAIAVALEPTVMADFLSMGRSSIEENLSRPDLLTFDAVLWRHGISRLVLWAAVAVICAVGAMAGRHPFWLSLWAMLAVTPIAWTHSTVQALPLLVAMWQSGQRGRFLSLLVGVAFVGTGPTGWNTSWSILVVVSGVAVVACPLGVDDSAGDAAPNARAGSH